MRYSVGQKEMIVHPGWRSFRMPLQRAGARECRAPGGGPPKTLTPSAKRPVVALLVDESDEWLRIYNEGRLHEALGSVPPLHFRPRLSCGTSLFTTNRSTWPVSAAVRSMGRVAYL